MWPLPVFECGALYDALNAERPNDHPGPPSPRASALRPARLTNLRTARRADMDLVLRITPWLRQPAAPFSYPAAW